MVDVKGDKLKKKLALLNLDPVVLTQFIGTLSNTRLYHALLVELLSESFVFPDDLRDKIKYDPATQKISFSNVIILAKRATLLASSGVTHLVEAAIHTLFDAPQSFFRRNFTTYFLYNHTAALASLLENLVIPTALRGKVYYDP